MGYITYTRISTLALYNIFLSVFFFFIETIFDIFANCIYMLYNKQI